MKSATLKVALAVALAAVVMGPLPVSGMVRGYPATHSVIKNLSL
jgi:hypothetical protein